MPRIFAFSVSPVIPNRTLNQAKTCERKSKQFEEVCNLNVATVVKNRLVVRAQLSQCDAETGSTYYYALLNILH